jgi:HrpA-like RNA helicase
LYFRVQPGKCYHLFTKHQLERLADYQVPEMLRTPLEELILQIKILKMGAVAAFLNKALEPPSETAVLNAITSLHQLVCVKIITQYSSIGRKFAAFFLCGLPQSVCFTNYL